MANAQQSRLGRGLGALLSESSRKINERDGNGSALGNDLIRRSLAAKQHNAENPSQNVDIAATDEQNKEVNKESIQETVSISGNNELNTQTIDAQKEEQIAKVTQDLSNENTNKEDDKEASSTIEVEYALDQGEGKSTVKIASDHVIHNILISHLKSSIYQPRQEFAQESLQELADSIKEHGLLEPLVVKRAENGNYSIICGERRYRAAILANLNVVPCIVKDVNHNDAYAVALIENIQRENLNPLEEAQAYERMIKECNYTQEQIAKSVGKPRSVIANLLRLLKLEDEVKTALRLKQITVAHAKILLNLTGEVQVKTCQRIIDKDLTVKATDEFVKELLQQDEGNNKKPAAKFVKSPRFSSYEESLNSTLNGVKARFSLTDDNKGKLTFSYENEDELNNLLDLLGLPHKIEEENSQEASSSQANNNQENNAL